MRRRRIAIIGAGFSGAAVAAQLLQQRGREAADVVLIERGRRFGPGLAYGGAERMHLLNVRASNMSAFSDAPEDFVQWLNRRERGEHKALFATRQIYGVYLEAVLDRASRSAWGRLRRVRAQALACRRDGEGWSIELDNDKTLSADSVVLATGNGPDVTPPVFEANGVPIFDAWDAAATRRLPRDGNVLIVGAGLTMIDLALALTRQKRIGTVYAISRRGLVPRAHLKTPVPAPPETVALPTNLSEALFVLRREVRANAHRGEPWQYAMDRLRPRTVDLWRRLTPDQQARFLRHLRPWWDVHRHRAAPEVSARVSELQATGKLRVLAGEIVAAQPISGGVELQHRQRGSYVRHRLEVARVINCTGASNHVADWSEPLMQQILAERLARPHPTGLGIDVDPHGRVLNADGAAQNDLVTLGPLTQGAFWESTAVPEIRVRAANLAQILSAQD